MRRAGLVFAAAFAALAPVAAGAADPITLSPEVDPAARLEPWLCETVAAYDARPEKDDFLDLFEDVVFHEEFCFATGGRCEMKLRRVERKVRAVLSAPTLGPDDPRRLAVGAGLMQTGKAATRVGLEVSLGEFESGERFAPFLIFVRPLAVLDGSQAPAKDDAVSGLLSQGDHGMALLENPCWVRPILDEGGDVRAAVVLVRDDLDPDLTGLCMMEETWNALGLTDPDGDASFFDDAWRRVPAAANPAEGLSALSRSVNERDLALLRLLYLPELRSGMTAAEAMPLVRKRLKRDCRL
ncbi:hypothetical protein P2H44_18880 [Albimonas sp. CAU 1670]|uniref:hypothetical protein n=1 Tax=Albimonas sp. CAU 1670 TaxID=3032599 RepID=UPI0023DB48C6|nr:hypothetical protein [Albimonas sp. CAU 1670]MDF2234629.1 hypothetical protein [Albimonas sp. CAU 1670]